MKVSANTGMSLNVRASKRPVHSRIGFRYECLRSFAPFSTQDEILPSTFMTRLKKCLGMELVVFLRIFTLVLTIKLFDFLRSSVLTRASWYSQVWAFLGLLANMQEKHLMGCACFPFQDVLLGLLKMNFVLVQKRAELLLLLFRLFNGRHDGGHISRRRDICSNRW